MLSCQLLKTIYEHKWYISEFKTQVFQTWKQRNLRDNFQQQRLPRIPPFLNYILHWFYLSICFFHVWFLKPSKPPRVALFFDVALLHQHIKTLLSKFLSTFNPIASKHSVSFCVPRHCSYSIIPQLNSCPRYCYFV